VLYAADAGLALVGDVVFAGSIGRTDLPGGDFQTLIASIRREVLTLPPKTRLLSGHGPETTVEWEARHNPFLIPHYGGELA
jgi:glyoxylase-like metal-dependent hydrolase (beta-lactamase superfamily II)